LRHGVRLVSAELFSGVVQSMIGRS